MLAETLGTLARLTAVTKPVAVVDVNATVTSVVLAFEPASVACIVKVSPGVNVLVGVVVPVTMVAPKTARSKIKKVALGLGSVR